MTTYKVTCERIPDAKRFWRLIDAASERSALQKAYLMLAGQPADYYVLSVEKETQHSLPPQQNDLGLRAKNRATINSPTKKSAIISADREAL